MTTTLEPRPLIVNWPIVAGDAESLTLVVTGIDVTARTYTCHVRTRPTAADIAATATCTTALVGADTEITIALTSLQTRALGDTGGPFVYDLQESAAGVISTLIAGNVTVRQDVTR